MSTVEDRYNIMKSITGIALVIALLIAFGNLLIVESTEIVQIHSMTLPKRRGRGRPRLHF